MSGDVKEGSICYRIFQDKIRHGDGTAFIYDLDYFTIFAVFAKSRRKRRSLG